MPPRDCDAWHDRWGDCARLDRHDGLSDPHATADEAGRFVTWRDDEQGAERG